MIAWAWHIHHEGWLCEPLTQPIEERIRFIRMHKQEAEVPIRLRLLKQVKGAVPPALSQIFAPYQDAYAAWERADAAWQKTDAAWQKAVEVAPNDPITLISRATAYYKLGTTKGGGCGTGDTSERDDLLAKIAAKKES